MYEKDYSILSLGCTFIPIIIEGLFQVFHQFPSSKLVLQTVESCFVALNYYENGSSEPQAILQQSYGDSHVLGNGSKVIYDGTL